MESYSVNENFGSAFGSDLYKSKIVMQYFRINLLITLEDSMLKY